MCLFWGGKSWFLAKHPSGTAVNCYRILVFTHFGSPSYGVGAEGDARDAGQRCPRSSVLVFVCPSLWLTPSPMPATPLLTLSAPFQRQLLCRPSQPSVPAEKRSPRPPDGSVLQCAIAGAALLHQSGSALWSYVHGLAGTVPAGPSPQETAMSWLLLHLTVSPGKEMLEPNFLRVFCWLPPTPDSPSLLL